MRFQQIACIYTIKKAADSTYFRGELEALIVGSDATAKELLLEKFGDRNMFHSAVVQCVGIEEKIVVWLPVDIEFPTSSLSGAEYTKQTSRKFEVTGGSLYVLGTSPEFVLEQWIVMHTGSGRRAEELRRTSAVLRLQQKTAMQLGRLVPDTPDVSALEV